MGVFLSFSGDLLKPDRAGAREALRAVAPGHLLLETDGVGELERLFEAVAGLRGIPVAELELLTWENGSRCFRELMA
jgi:Tat protein secretion system quality control protein TatD with DNase activity